MKKYLQKLYLSLGLLVCSSITHADGDASYLHANIAGSSAIDVVTARGTQASPADAGWGTNIWRGDGQHNAEKQGDEWVIALASDDGADMAWTKVYAVEHSTRYRLTGKIKTLGVEARTGRGALLNIHQMRDAVTKPVTGNSDWTEVSVIFNSGTRDSVMVNALLGGWGQSTGTAYYKDIKLEPIGEQAQLNPIEIDAAALRPEMSELIYSQFIEHMGRCIYGGIWAEMLEDRKFYFPITADYNPYGNDAKFPPVVRSPWQIVGSADQVEMVENDPFVGDHDPQLGPDVTIQQRDLGVVQGKKYQGYIWLKGVSGEPAVKVSLDLGDSPAVIKPRAGEYTRYAFEFTAKKSSDEAVLVIDVDGGVVRLGTLSLMPADNIEGMRADTLDLLKQLRSPLYRWPGGNFVSGYDWRDGIGDRDRRPPRTNPAWTGVEHNDFGMHEFIRFCELLNTEPMITINMGFEGAFSAEAQMDYVNGNSDTAWGRVRKKNGSANPFGVKYWCIGNEMFGHWQLGHMSNEDYQIKHNWVVDRLRKKYPDFISVASGDIGRGWSKGLLENCAGRMDMIAEHLYVRRGRENVNEHVSELVKLIRDKAEYHRGVQSQLGLTGDKKIPIAMTEWNYWYGPYPYGELGTVYYLKDALGVAAGLNEYARCSDIIGSAFYAQTVNVIGCIKTTKTDAFLAATALPLIMYRDHFGTAPLELNTGNASEYNLDIAAAWTEDRTAITVAVVNASSKTQVLKFPITGAKITGAAERWWFAGDDPKLINTAQEAALTIQHEVGVDWSSPIEVPGYSATIYRIPVVKLTNNSDQSTRLNYENPLENVRTPGALYKTDMSASNTQRP